MNSPHFPFSRSPRTAGAIDMRDVAIGLVLAIVIPIVFAFLGPAAKDDPYAFGKHPNIVVAPDAEQIEGRMKVAEQAYTTNAKAFVKRALETEDGTLKEYFRRWAARSLAGAADAVANARRLINDDESPAVRNQFASSLARLDVLQKQIDADVASVKKLDILGRDAK